MNENNKRLRELEEENARLKSKIQKLEKLHTQEELNSAKRVSYRYAPPKTSKPDKPKNVRSDFDADLSTTKQKFLLFFIFVIITYTYIESIVYNHIKERDFCDKT